MRSFSLLLALTLFTTTESMAQHKKTMQSGIPETRSFYPEKPADPEALYFLPENFPVKADGKTDVSEALQKAINEV